MKSQDEDNQTQNRTKSASPHITALAGAKEVMPTNIGAGVNDIDVGSSEVTNSQADKTSDVELKEIPEISDNLNNSSDVEDAGDVKKGCETCHTRD